MDKPSYSPRGKALIVCYIVLCLLLFVYLRFPYHLLKPKLETALGAAVHKEVTVGGVSARLPLGVRLTDVRVAGETIAPRLTLRPLLLGLITGKVGIAFAVDQDKGHLHGRFKTSLRHPGDPIDLTLKMKTFDIASLKNLFKGADEIGGILDGTCRLNISREHSQDTEAALDLVWADGQIPLNIPSLPLGAIPFTRLEVEARTDRGMLAIRKGKLTGKDISGSLSGSMRFGANLTSSVLNITGELRLSQGYRSLLGGVMGERLRFRLGGTLSAPQFNVQ